MLISFEEITANNKIFEQTKTNNTVASNTVVKKIRQTTLNHRLGS